MLRGSPPKLPMLTSTHSSAAMLSSLVTGGMRARLDLELRMSEKSKHTEPVVRSYYESTTAGELGTVIGRLNCAQSAGKTTVIGTTRQEHDYGRGLAQFMPTE